MIRAGCTVAAGAIVLVLACVVAGCAEPTQLVVYVWTDMTVPLEIEQVRVRVFTVGDPSPSYDNTVPLPASGRMDFRTDLSFGAGPRGEDTTRRVRVLVDAIKAGTTLFTTEVRTGFARRKKLRLDVYLARRCLVQAATCMPDETCGLDGCVSPDVPVDSLPPASTPPTTPRDPRTPDAGGGIDGGPTADAGSSDAGPADASVVATDAGPPDASGLPPPPRRIAPLSSSRTGSSTVTLAWEPPPAGTTVEYLVNGLDGSMIARFGGLSSSSVTITSVVPATYLWQVRSTGPGGTGAWSPPWVFVVPRALGAHVVSWGTYPDITRDGLGDVAVATPVAPSRNAQVVFYPSSPATGLSTTGLVSGLTDPGAAGLAVACAGDVNGDGNVDILVGSPESETTRGIVDVFYGSSTGLSAAPDLVLRPMGPGERFGAAVASAGDVDGDGYADIVVGAPDAGVAYVFRGGASGIDPMWRDRLMPPGASIGPSSFGTSVAGTDLDADGRGDVIVGSPRANVTHGSVFAFRSRRTAFDAPTEYVDSSPSITTGFGSALASGETLGSGSGEVAILHSLGSVGSRIALFHGDGTGGLVSGPAFGSASPIVALAAAGDFAGDDRHDVIGGALFAPDTRGQLTLLDTAGTPTLLVAGSAGQYIGDTTGYLGDVDGDGNDELAYAVLGATAAVVVLHGPYGSGTTTYLPLPGGAYDSPGVRIAGAQ